MMTELPKCSNKNVINKIESIGAKEVKLFLTGSNDNISISINRSLFRDNFDGP